TLQSVLGQNLPQPLHLPWPGVAEGGEAQAGGGLAGAGEEALHQGAFVVLQRPQPRTLGPDQIVQRRQAIGDFLLFVFNGRQCNLTRKKSFIGYVDRIFCPLLSEWIEKDPGSARRLKESVQQSANGNVPWRKDPV